MVKLKENTFATVGSSALETLKRYCFDKSFIGMNGIDVKYGLTTPDEQEALIKDNAMRLSNESFVVVDKRNLIKCTLLEYLCKIILESLPLNRDYNM